MVAEVFNRKTWWSAPEPILGRRVGRVYRDEPPSAASASVDRSLGQQELAYVQMNRTLGIQGVQHFTTPHEVAGALDGLEAGHSAPSSSQQGEQAGALLLSRSDNEEDGGGAAVGAQGKPPPGPAPSQQR